MSQEDLTRYCYLNNLPVSINKLKQDKDILIRVSIDKAFIFISCADYNIANKLLEFVNNNQLEAHEVFTHNHKKFKVFFDIDIENPKEYYSDIEGVDDSLFTIQLYVYNYIECLKEVINNDKFTFRYTYRIKTDSNGNIKKFGIHIITDLIIDNISKIKSLIDLMKNNLKDSNNNIKKYLYNFIDSSPYSYNKSLSLPNGFKNGIQSKCNDIIINNDNFYFITHTYDFYTDLSNFITIKKPDIQSFDISTDFIDIIRSNYYKIPEIDSFMERKINNNFINFKRLTPALCSICNVIHDNENSLYIILNPEKQTAFYNCLRNKDNNKFKSKLLYANNEITISLKDKIESIYSNISNFNSDKIINEKNIKSDYPVDENTLLIKSSTGTGKTKQLIKYLNKHKYEKVLMITFRRTLAYEFENKFKELGFESYLNCNINNTKKLIIQVESLYKLNNYEYDLVILDESESIIDQFYSTTNKKNYTSNMFVFKELLNNKIIAMDAYMSNKTIELFKKSYIINNEYNAEKSKKYYFTRTKEIIDNEIIKALKKDKKIVIAITTSKTDAYYYESYIKEYYPNKTYKIYTCETDNHDDLKNVHESWNDLDILIYTPTISAGISFEKKQFDLFFGLFSPDTTSVKSCLQMCNRVRDISSKKYCIYIKKHDCKFSNYITNKKDLLNLLKCNQDIRNKYIEETNSSMELLHYILKSNIDIDNFQINMGLNYKLEKNKDKSYFLNNFISLLKSYGAKCFVLNKEEIYYSNNKSKDNKELIKKLENEFISKDLKHESRDIKKNIPKIIEAREISDDEANDIQESKKLEDKYALHKYFLRKIFNYTKELNEDNLDFMLKSSNQNTMRNIKYLYKNDDLDILFSNLSQQSNMSLDINTQFHKLKELQQLYKLFNFEFDYKTLTEKSTSNNILKEDLLNYNFSNFCMQFEKADINEKNIIEILKSVLNKYGIIIDYKQAKCNNKKTYKYKIKFNNEHYILENDKLTINI